MDVSELGKDGKKRGVVIKQVDKQVDKQVVRQVDKQVDLKEKIILCIQSGFLSFVLIGSIVILFVAGRRFPFSDYDMFAHTLNKNFIFIYQLKAVSKGRVFYPELAASSVLFRWHVAEFFSRNRSNPTKLKSYLQKLETKLQAQDPEIDQVSIVFQKIKPIQDEFFKPFRLEVIDEEVIITHSIPR